MLMPNSSDSNRFDQLKGTPWSQEAYTERASGEVCSDDDLKSLAGASLLTRDAVEELLASENPVEALIKLSQDIEVAPVSKEVIGKLKKLEQETL
jgi:hypothetical protein